MSQARKRALLGGVISLLAAAGIIIPGLSEEGPPAPTPGPSTPVQEQPVPEGAPIDASAEEIEGITLTLAAIATGDLPYEEDGGTFQNREGLLPDRPLGYYSEYTVETPGSLDRGARRLVIGDGGETYYTADHYSSFTEIDQEDFR